MVPPKETQEFQVIYSHDGLAKDSFSWGLGHNTNNQAKNFGFFKGCQVAQVVRWRRFMEILLFKSSVVQKF